MEDLKLNVFNTFQNKRNLRNTEGYTCLFPLPLGVIGSLVGARVQMHSIVYIEFT